MVDPHVLSWKVKQVCLTVCVCVAEENESDRLPCRLHRYPASNWRLHFWIGFISNAAICHPGRYSTGRMSAALKRNLGPFYERRHPSSVNSTFKNVPRGPGKIQTAYFKTPQQCHDNKWFVWKEEIELIFFKRWNGFNLCPAENQAKIKCLILRWYKFNVYLKSLS